jgi:hypothetical protein
VYAKASYTRITVGKAKSKKQIKMAQTEALTIAKVCVCKFVCVRVCVCVCVDCADEGAHNG